MTKKILLFGPELSQAKAAYGGGAGGYTRNMATYLSCFRDDKYEMYPFFHSVRKKQFGLGNLFVVRFLRDMCLFFLSVLCRRPSIVHVLAQYRSAMPREFGILLCCILFRIPLVYEIKAGLFDTWLKKANRLQRWMIRTLIKKSALVLVEGERYIDILQLEFCRTSYYFPNHVPDDEVPETVEPIFSSELLRIVFVGFCYDGKGVFELLEGCNLAAQAGVRIELSLVGEEEPRFTTWADAFSCHENLSISRFGRLGHDRVLEVLMQNDVFSLPSKHPGEGHNNTVNEAMMLGKCLLVSRAGFLGDILSTDTAFLLKDVSAKEISDSIIQMNNERPEACLKARRAREILLQKYTTGVLYPELIQHYDRILGTPKT